MSFEVSRRRAWMSASNKNHQDWTDKHTSTTYRNSRPQKILQKRRQGLGHMNSTTDTTTMTVHHKKKTLNRIITTLDKVIVPASALTHNGQSASEFKRRSGGARLTCSSPSFPAWQFVSDQSVTSDELPGTRPAQDRRGTEGGGGLKP